MILSSFLLAFCGIIYELTLAQTNSILLGNSSLQYGITIGLFMAGLGAGAWKEYPVERAREMLIRLQTLLAFGAPAGYLLLWLGALFLPAWLLWPFSCTLIFAIGFITGRELPLLMHLAGSGKANLVLGADYFGMLAATVLFPYFLLPVWGTLGALALAALINAVCILLLRPEKAWRFSPLALVMVSLIVYREPVSQWFSLHYAPL